MIAYQGQDQGEDDKNNNEDQEKKIKPQFLDLEKRQRKKYKVNF